MKVIFTPEARLYLQELAHILYFKNYFGFEDSAEKYVRSIYADIMTNLPAAPRKPATPYFNRFGKSMYYITIRKNRHTLWYVFFNMYNIGGEHIYLIRYINNNHMVSQFL